MTAAINRNASNSATQQVKDFLSSGYGIFRGSATVRAMAETAREVGRLVGDTSLNSNLALTEQVCGAVGGGLALPRFAVLTLGLPERVQAAATEPSEGSLVKLFKDTLEWVGMGIASLGMFSVDTSPLKTPGKIISLTDGAVGLYEAGSSWLKARAAEGSSDVRVREQSQESQKLHLLSIAKAVCSIALGVIGLITLFWAQAFTVPVIAMCALGLFGHGLALAYHFYKENMTYQPIQL